MSRFLLEQPQNDVLEIALLEHPTAAPAVMSRSRTPKLGAKPVETAPAPSATTAPSATPVFCVEGNLKPEVLEHRYLRYNEDMSALRYIGVLGCASCPVTASG